MMNKKKPKIMEDGYELLYSQTPYICLHCFKTSEYIYYNKNNPFNCLYLCPDCFKKLVGKQKQHFVFR